MNAKMLAREEAQKIDGSDEPTPARELGLWLRALRSFFDQANHPFAEAERADISTRSFSCETAIARDVLFRCLQLVRGLSSAEGDIAAPPTLAALEPEAVRADGRWRPSGVTLGESGLDELTEILKDACGLAGALLKAPAVSFEGWSSLGNVLTRELRGSETAALLTGSPAGVGALLTPEPLAALAERLTPDELGDSSKRG
jgi:hypothetical protein